MGAGSDRTESQATSPNAGSAISFGVDLSELPVRKPMDMRTICYWEATLMAVHLAERDWHYPQSNWHCWAWLNYHLAEWGKTHPFRVGARLAKDALEELRASDQPQATGGR